VSNVQDILNRLEKAVALDSNDAAIRMRAEYAPQAGPEAKIFPPTYMLRDNTRYHFERRWTSDGRDVEVVMLDSYQSQANRCETALAREAAALGLPRIVMRATVGGRTIEISSLEAPHRSRDAYFLDSRVDGRPFDATDVGRELDQATLNDLTPLLKYAPTDLVYGVWDSHRGKRIALKLSRSYTSEMLGWEPKPGRRAATKGDPLNLPGKDKVPAREWRPEGTSAGSARDQQKLSDLGHGMIPSEPDPTNGGVAVRAITRLGLLSFPAIAQLRFGDEARDRAGRVLVAALGLLGDRLAFSAAGLHLRSGCDLVLKRETLEWVRRDDKIEPLPLSVDDARELFKTAKEQLAQTGIVWNPEPVIVVPSKPLQEVIERVLLSRGESEEE
jgi:CRISPR-associated protein Csb1